MAVYVDDEQIPWRGKLWCHLVADSLPELHAFACQLGLKQAWFQSRSTHPHYDVTINVRDRALVMGAVMGDRRTIITRAKQLKEQMSLKEKSMSKS